MFSSRSFSNAPWAPRTASYYHPTSVQASQATANVQPASVSITVVAAPPAPEPVIIPEPTPTTPAPILHSFDAASSTAPISKAEPTAISAIASMTCVKDSQVIQDKAAEGLRNGLLKGVGSAILKKDPEQIIKGAVMGYVKGTLEGEAVAAQTCIPTLPRNVPPKP